MCCYGGGSKWEQSKALEGGAEIIVGTPGRVIDLVKMSATNLTRVTFLVLDEADRMFNMGFGKCDWYYLLMCSVNKCVILMFECICM